MEELRSVQPPYAENGTYGGVGGLSGAIPATRPDHHVIKVCIAVPASDVIQGELAWVFTGDPLKSLDSLKLSLVRPGVLKACPPNDLNGSKRPSRTIPPHPDFTIGAPVYWPDQLIIRDKGWSDSR